ncbi:MAG: hypothetical protein GF411_12455 [Candidatus Lokiarchaeota archaeon]|nr:hypothetical protein [Candidatus Lokiarchaeota archaeon]
MTKGKPRQSAQDTLAFSKLETRVQFCHLREFPSKEDTMYLGSVDLSNLYKLEQMQELIFVERHYLSSIDLSPLANCTSLETLAISDCGFETLDLSPLSLIPNLTCLVLNETIYTPDFRPLVDAQP